MSVDGQNWVVLGSVVRPRGVRGEVVVELLTNSATRFVEVGEVSAVPPNGSGIRLLQVEKAWPHQERAVVKFAGVDSMDEAEKLRGVDLCIPLEKRRKPAPGEILFSDLVDCKVYDPQGKELGTIVDWMENGDLAWLCLEPGEHLIPFAKEYFVDLNFAEKRVTVQLPDGLLDLNPA